MKFTEYQAEARKTAIYPMPVIYPTIGLAGECGEIAEKVKKSIRDKNGVIESEDKQNLAKELGDVLWYLANLAEDLGLSLEDIARQNIDKLKSRQDRDKIHGSGDNR